MEESNFMMALLIPGLTSPGKDFELFLEPMVEDLLELWTCVHAYDARSGKMFKLCALVKAGISMKDPVHQGPKRSTPNQITLVLEASCPHEKTIQGRVVLYSAMGQDRTC
jgi:hypothetical protein